MLVAHSVLTITLAVAGIFGVADSFRMADGRPKSHRRFWSSYIYFLKIKCLGCGTMGSSTRPTLVSSLVSVSAPRSTLRSSRRILEFSECKHRPTILRTMPGFPPPQRKYFAHLQIFLVNSKFSPSYEVSQNATKTCFNNSGCFPVQISNFFDVQVTAILVVLCV